MDDELIERAAMHAALGEPLRLAIVEELASSDRTSNELCERFGLPGNLLAHHLATLERAGLVRRVRSSGDGRRRYVQLLPEPLALLGVGTQQLSGRVLFVCTHNSARSQLAAALWRAHTGHDADSAGTEPSDAVHPGTLAAARRHGVDLADARPRALRANEAADFVITVCDRAREDLAGDVAIDLTGVPDHPDPVRHWSIGDPASTGTAAAFDDAVDAIRERIERVSTPAPPDAVAHPT